MAVTRESLGERVRRVMTNAGLTQAQLAERVGINASSLSRALSGQRNFKSLEIALIAEALNVTADYLLAEEEPAPMLLAARTQLGTSPALDKALERIQQVLDLDQLLVDLGFGVSGGPAFHASGELSAYEQGEELAQKVRAEIGVGDEALPYDLSYLARLVEDHLAIDVVFEPLEPGVDGLSIARGDFRLAFVASGASATRQRFTLAHEVGHLILGDSQRLVVDENLYGRRMPDEERANAFAAALLMPASALRRRVSRGYLSEKVVADLLGRYGVSLDSLAFRLYRLKLVNVATCARIRSMASVRIALRDGRTADLQARNYRRLPGGLLYRATEAYVNGSISIRPVAGLIGVEPEQLLGELAPATRESPAQDLASLEQDLAEPSL